MAGDPRPVGRLRVEGGPRLRATLKAAGSQLSDLKALHAKVAEVVADRAEQTAPIGPPPVHVRDTIRPAGTKAAAIVRAGKSRVAYAMSVHWGRQTSTGRIVKAQPWIAQAAQHTQPAWTQLYLTELQKICDSVEGTSTP